MKLIKGKVRKENGSAYYGAFAQHDSTGGGLNDKPNFASPGIDSDETDYGTHRSGAGQIDNPIGTLPVNKGVVTLKTIGGHKQVKRVV